MQLKVSSMKLKMKVNFIYVFILLLGYAGCSVSKEENPCWNTADKFARGFNRQDFTGVARIFSENELDMVQFKRLRKNLRYIFNVAGAMRTMNFIRRKGNKLIYRSVHEQTSMDITFRVNQQCQLISYLIQTHYPDSLPVLERNTTSLTLPFHRRIIIL